MLITSASFFVIAIIIAVIIAIITLLFPLVNATGTV